jgi:hypothetical protein
MSNYGISVPRLFSISFTVGTDRDWTPHPLSPLLSLFLFLLFSDGSLQPVPLCCISRSFPLLSLAFPFSSMNPSCMRLFPHVFLIIYTFFHFSAPFFSALPISQARFSYLPPYPLICAAMHRHFPECFTYPLSLQSFDPAKTSLGARSARLFLIITSIRQRNVCVHKTIALFGATRK